MTVISAIRFQKRLPSYCNALLTWILILISLCWTPSLAQQPIFESQLFTTDDGLANLNITAIHKDRTGFLWIGTNYGLNRYDGYAFKHYTKAKNGLSETNGIERILEDEAGNLWLYVLSKRIEKYKPVFALKIFDPKKEEVIESEDYFTSPLPFEEQNLNIPIVSDPQHRLWITTAKGELFLYANKQFKKVFEKENVIFTHITADKQDNICLAYGNVVTCIDHTGKILDEVTLPNDIFGLWADSTGNTIWIATEEYVEGLTIKISVYAKQKGEAKAKPFVFYDGKEVVPTSGYIMETIYRDQAGYWHYFSDWASFIFDKDGNQVFNAESEQNPTSTVKTYFEEENFIWGGSAIGLRKTSIKKNPFRLIYDTTKPRVHNYRSIAEDNKGQIYFHNHVKFCRWDAQKDTAIHMNKIHGFFNYTLIYQDSFFWSGTSLSTENDLTFGYKMNTITNEIVIYQSSKKYPVHSAIASVFPNRFLASPDQGLIYIDYVENKTLPFTKYGNTDKDSILQNSTGKFLHRNPSGVWMASNNGIFLVDENQGLIQHFDAPTSLPFSEFQHIHEDKEGIFWLASKGGGLIKWQPDINKPAASTYQQFTTTDGLSNNYLYAVYEDDFNRLWISSDKGLICMDKASEQFRTYTTSDGLPHNEFNFSSHYKAKDGTLYFGGLAGIIYFHPADLKNDVTQTPLVITDYHLLEGETGLMVDKTNWLKQSNEIIIRPTDRLFELKFALLDYEAPTEHRYAYQIKGYSEHWQQIDENFIRLTNLPYGHYTLNIKGQHKRNGWSSNELAIPIHVLTPFYLQWWFIALIIAVLVGVSLAAVKWRITQLKEQQRKLEAEVQKRTRTIAAQAEDLKVLDKAKTRFFSNVTHEFRTPLTLIIGPLEQVLKNQLPPNIFKRRLNGVLNNARHLLTLINQMLDLSKLESGQMNTEVSKGDIVHYTQELVGRFEPLIEKKGLRFKFICNQDSWETYFDKEKWDKIIYNLFSNALKFTPKGETVQLSLMQTVFNGQEAIRLDVKDTGIGIKEEQLNQVFNRFYQVDDSSKRVQGGTGIGLALVKELIELQGGEIWVSSQLNQGTSFEVYLPILNYEQQAVPTKKGLEVPILPNLNVLEEKTKEQTTTILNKNGKLDLLIIEDNREIREYIRYCLDSSKYHITEAVDGEDGMQKAQAIVPDLIISDVMMPRKNGFEVVQEVRNHLATSHIPIILLTAKASLESRLEGLKRGADVYLTKPFSPDELLVRIEKLIEIRRIIQQRYQQNQPNLLSNGTETYQKEDAFITDLKQHILKNIDQPLTGDIIGRHFGMSRVHLYRKLKALTNQSISEFVKQIRLEKAKELILARELNISEITYQTGFSSISYFSRSFKKAYGVSPSEM